MLQVGGGGGAYGITLYYSTYQDVYFNSVNITSSNVTSGMGFYVTGTTTSVNVVNNVFANPGGGYAVYVDATAAAGITTSDYNDLYTVGNFIGYWGATSYPMLSDLQAASLKDASSISVYPSFTSATDLHSVSPWLDGAGTAVSPAISTDYDGERALGAPRHRRRRLHRRALDHHSARRHLYHRLGGRATPPSPRPSTTSCSRGSPPRSPSRCSRAPTTTHFTLTPVPGASSTNTVTFTVAIRDPSTVTVYYAAAGASDNYVVLAQRRRLRPHPEPDPRLQQRPQLHLRHPSSTSTGGVEDARVEGNTITGTITNGSGANQTLVYGPASLYTSRDRQRQHVQRRFVGRLARRLQHGDCSPPAPRSTTTPSPTRATATSSSRTSPAPGSTATPAPAPTPTAAPSSSTATPPSRSRRTGSPSPPATASTSTSATAALEAPLPGPISNNMVSVGGGGAAYGITLYYSTYQDVYFNSVNITSSNVDSGVALYVTGTTTSTNVVNNVFANPGGGYAIYVDASAVGRHHHIRLQRPVRVGDEPRVLERNDDRSLGVAIGGRQGGELTLGQPGVLLGDEPPRPEPATRQRGDPDRDGDGRS